MLNRLRSFAFILAGLVCLLASDYASAMYDPGVGRFLQRDPSGYPDGMNSYGAYHVMRGGGDPTGLCTSDCICETNPEDCYLEYSTTFHAFKHGTYSKDGQKIGYYQQFNIRYYVKLKSHSGASTCGCHIEQSAFTISVYSDQQDAVQKNPGDFGKAADDPGFFSTTYEWFQTAVFSGDINDYVPEDTNCIDNVAQINDKPGVWLNMKGHARPMEGRLDGYIFIARNWVTEAPNVHGTFTAMAVWDWTGAGNSKFTAQSSDGNINLSRP